MLTINDMKEMLPKLNYADQQILERAGLQKLGELYVAYPITLKTESLCVLVKKGTTAKKAAELSETEMIRFVLVLRRDGKNWVRAWPAP